MPSPPRRLVALLLLAACDARVDEPSPPIEAPVIAPSLAEPSPPIDPPRLADPEPDPPAAAPPLQGQATAPPLPLVERLLPASDERDRLTLDYRARHEGDSAAGLDIAPTIIVLHHTGGGSLDAAWRYFARDRVEAGRKTIASAGALNVAAHYLIDRDGTIVQILPDTRFARHCIGLNHLAIGVENIGDGAKFPLTEAQVEANAALVRHLAARYPITHLIGHHEAPRLYDHPYFLERDPKYRTRKGDPGPAFMAAVRARLADHPLAAPPP
jgi:N-acetylmuramoyl-L-alanine amidase